MSSTSERWFGAGHSTAADSAKAGVEATAAALEGRRPAAVFVFCSGGHDPAAVLAGVRAEAGPDAVVAGGTGFGELTPAGATQHGVAVAALGGEGFTVRAHAAGIGELGARAAGAEAARVMAGLDAPHAALLLLSDGTAVGPQEVVRGAYSVVGAAVPLVGGLTSDSRQLCGDQVLTNSVVGVALGSDRPIGIGIAHGWRRIEPPLVVTRSGEGRIYEFDGEPALDVLMRRCGGSGTADELFQGGVNLRPLGLSRRSGEDIRSLHAGDDQERSVFGTTEIPQGALVWLMEGEHDELVAGAGTAPEERQMLQGMAQMLGAALRSIRALAAERTLWAERERETRLVEALLTIQRAISSRRPLQEILDLTTAGAAELLGGAHVALVLTDPQPRVASNFAGDWTDERHREAARSAMAAGDLRVQEVPGGVVIAAPVQVTGGTAGSLVACLDGPAGHRPDQLAAFAQQVGLALTDARTVEQVHEAHRDHVTGLPNRALFLRIFHEHPDSGVLFIDLDRFKAVNDSLGHDAGDQLLAAVAERIRGCVRAADTVARLGGDEFAVLLADADATAAVAAGGRIIAAVREPFRLLGRSVYIGASVGAALPGAAGAAPDELLDSADLAMYRAKKEGPGRVVVYEPAMREAALDYLSLRGDLQRALAEGEFGLQYQPLIRLDDEGPGAVVGVEALLRWNSPSRGTVPPADFLPIAEESGLIADIGQWVLATAARQVAVWRRGRPGLTLNVNVSGHELVRPGFAAQVTRSPAAAGLPTSAVTLELTESVLMSDPRAAVAALTDLRALGVQLSIDDFGTGYSSLAYLRELPVDELKVDRAFIARAELTGRDLALVSTIMELGHILGLRVVAEGIENQAQLDAVRRLGCALGQGFHLYRPMDPAQLPALLVPPAALSPAA
ncbi:bifunctional diguanylate cyclase/phosphodiesterase [Dactylosporangium salmoneum]|uniref:Diguanylate cyclase (GGDEF)-like protein n=1 Tax=Dactylosporangium salmoneum TaxID=53361 RepID=A0ABN3I046_9ACTN